MGNPQGPPVSASPLDLTDIQTVKGWLGSTAKPAGDNDDANIQLCITGASMWWLDQTGLGNTSGINTTSPLNSQVTYTETYNGTGSARLYLRNRPIISVTSLTVGQVQVQQSMQYGMPGWVIDQDMKSIWIRGGSGGGNNISFSSIGWPTNLGGAYFVEGIQNVQVTYVAGYPSVPIRVQMAVTQQVAENYKAKEWIGQSSKALANGAGSINYRSWKLAPAVLATLTDYTRTSM